MRYVIQCGVLNEETRKGAQAWTTVHDSGLAGPKLVSPKITRAANSVDSLTFCAPFGSAIFPGASFARRMLVRVLRYTGGSDSPDTRFLGMVTKVVDSMAENGTLQAEYACEGALGYLNDTYQPWHDLYNTTVETRLGSLLRIHSMRVLNGGDYVKRLELGVISPADLASESVRYGSASSDRITSMEEAQTNIVGVHGGYLVARPGTTTDWERLIERGTVSGSASYPAYPWSVVDYLGDPGEEIGSIELGRNMRSCTVEVDPDDIVSVLYPLGEEYEHEGAAEGSAKDRTEPSHGVSIDSAGNVTDVEDSTSVVDAAALASYGVVESVKVYDRLTDTIDLLANGVSWVKANNDVHASVVVSAYDLATIGVDPELMEMYNKVHVRNSLLSINETMRIVKMVEDIESPIDSTFEFGRLSKTASGSR